jgi:hypothetical protein
MRMANEFQGSPQFIEQSTTGWIATYEAEIFLFSTNESGGIQRTIQSRTSDGGYLGHYS